MTTEELQTQKSDALQNKEPVKVVIFDMDDTIVKTSKYRRGTLKRGEELPEDFFIEHSLELIRNLKNAGVKVGIVSHAYVGYQPEVTNALTDMGLKVDSFVTIKDVVSDTILLNAKNDPIFQSYINLFAKIYRKVMDVYGKQSSAHMAELSFKNMGISPDKDGKYPHVQVVTIGDSAADVYFAGHIKSQLSCTKTMPIHVNAVDLAADHLAEAKEAINSIKASGGNVEEIKSYSEIYPILAKELGIDLEFNPAKESTAQKPTTPSQNLISIEPLLQSFRERVNAITAPQRSAA